MLYVNCYSQIPNGNELLLSEIGATSEKILASQHISVVTRLVNTRLRDVYFNKDGTFGMFYSQDIGDYNSSKIYSFTKSKICYNVRYIFDITDRDEFIEDLLKGDFYRKSPFVYYHKTLNLMVSIQFDKKFYSVDYSKKPINSK